MAQLPPKVPSMPQNWPSSFPFQMMPLPSSATAVQPHNSWVDEFLDFSAARRSSHRRSASDSIAFVETQFVEECRNSANPRKNSSSCNNNGGHGGGGFEGLDDEQLRHMFSDDVVAASAVTGPSTLSSSNPSSTNPSTPSDHNSDNDEKNAGHQDQNHNNNLQSKNESGDVDILSRIESQTQSPSNPSSNVISPDAIVDPKRIKRILANRQSAQRSRVRKLQYISELERSVTTLQTEVSVLSPRVAFLDHQRLILNFDNSALKQRIAALAQDKIFKDAHQEALRKEIERLRQVYHEQNVKKMGSNSCENGHGNGGSTNEASHSPPTTPTPPPPSQPNFNNTAAAANGACTDQ